MQTTLFMLWLTKTSECFLIQYSCIAVCVPYDKFCWTTLFLHENIALVLEHLLQTLFSLCSCTLFSQNHCWSPNGDSVHLTCSSPHFEWQQTVNALQLQVKKISLKGGEKKGSRDVRKHERGKKRNSGNLISCSSNLCHEDHFITITTKFHSLVRNLYS